MDNDIKSYTLQEIADWQLKDSENIKLPTLQRGFVWKTAQIETLWDSLLRGFPVGSFLFSRNETGENGEKYLVLDGQQRATAITLGYYSPWTMKEAERKFWSLTKIPVLWFDVSPEAAAGERKFVIRVVTQSHPWGYRCTDNSEILNIAERREALEIFREIHEIKKLEYTGYTQLPAENVFPYDCNLPVPFAFLIEALKQNNWKTALIKMCEDKLPYKYIRTKETKEDYHTKLLTCINNDKIKPEILEAIKNLGRIRIPAIIVPNRVLQAEDKGEGDDPTLFVRLNSQGTQIKGEELIYSIYKAAFPKSKDLVEKTGLGFLAPSRVINLSARLVWSKINGDEYPASMAVNQFRQRIKKDGHNKNFAIALNNFIDGKDRVSAPVLFDRAIQILLGEGGIDVPAVFLKGLVNKSQELFLMILQWLKLRLEQEPEFKPSKDEAKKILAVFTALSWFCKKPEQYVRGIWRSIGKEAFLTKRILQEPFFNKNDCIMYPLLQPEILKEFLLDKVVSRHEEWNNLRPQEDDKIFTHYAQSLPKGLKDGEITNAVRYAIWDSFRNKLFCNKDLILFAQRDYINKNFRDFNQLEDLEDTNRPWDWDHIYPAEYVFARKDVDKNIRKWTGSIGNLRALALEDNRGLKNIPPAKRLGGQYENNKVIKTGEEIRTESFVHDDWKDWQEIKNRIYDNEHQERAAYLRAVINRLCNIYREWYDKLNIGDLFSPENK